MRISLEGKDTGLALNCIGLWYHATVSCYIADSCRNATLIGGVRVPNSATENRPVLKRTDKNSHSRIFLPKNETHFYSPISFAGAHEINEYTKSQCNRVIRLLSGIFLHKTSLAILFCFLFFFNLKATLWSEAIMFLPAVKQNKIHLRAK